jgi:hypothetical protein
MTKSEVITIVLVILFFALFMSFVIPITVEYKMINIKDKCCSANGNQCYIFDTDGTRYITEKPDVYSEVPVGGVYRAHVYKYWFSPDMYIYDGMTLEEYNQSCEARGMC